MTDPPGLAWSWSAPASHVARLSLNGDLDHESADLVLADVIRHLAEHPGLGELRLDCRELDYCDSAGLSTLLMIRRRAATAGVYLALDDRGPALDRLLRVTNTLAHLTGAVAAQREHRLDP